ncbi:MAG: 3-hydroxyacyl-CoA dehydrogenase family protein [Ignavibacteriae bacterium]|nr:MAG: 3-hydroxyacyl-CoA dehydrogenase family protein [Ignavibacteriota bacterium]
MAEKIEKLEDYNISKRVKPKANPLAKIGIIGCGEMGQDIALLCSSHGIDVVFIEISALRVKEAINELNAKLDELINRWGITGSEKRAVMSRIKGYTDYNVLKKCGIIIEAVSTHGYENVIPVKKEIFKKIENVVPKETIIATNSSTIVISELASVLNYPERAVGLHFLAPADRVKIVEVVRSLVTSDEAIDFVEKFARAIDKKVIHVNESAGNISTRLIVPLINEACELYLEGVGNIKDIDDTMKLGYGLQLGPFEMADKIGLDKVAKWMDNLFKEFGDKKYIASPLIKKLVRSNRLGRISEEGFYSYKNGIKTGVAED